MITINNYYGNRYNIKDINNKVWFTVFVEILEYLWEILNILMDTNSDIFTTNLKNKVLALITVNNTY